MIDKEFAIEFAQDWIAAWNSRDLARVLSHYADDFVMSSPIIAQIGAEPSGVLTGKAAVGEYWVKALAMIPELHFDLLTTLVGVDSITLYYQSPKGLAAEVFHFDADRKVIRAYAHYTTST
jgi:hypothetical protein